MSQETNDPDFLTADQKETIAAVRKHLLSVHNSDTSSLNDIEMAARMAASRA